MFIEFFLVCIFSAILFVASLLQRILTELKADKPAAAPVEVHHHTTEVRHVAPPAPAAPPTRSDLVQVLKKYAHGWDHHGWVQRGSDAHADALRRPAYAIKDGESIDHGVQD